MKRRFLRRATAAVLAACVALCGCSRRKSPAVANGMSGSVTLWAYAMDGEEQLDQAFNKNYPNIKVDLVPVPWADYESRLNLALAAHLNVPNIALCESYWWGKWQESNGVFDDLSQYGLNRTVILGAGDKIADDRRGRLIIAPVSYGIGCIWYNKPLVKKYLQTDSQDSLQAKLSTWQDYLALGERVKRESGGTDFLFADTVALMEFLIASDSGYVSGNAINLSGKIAPKVELAAEMLQKGYVARYNNVELYDSYREGHVLFYPYADWNGQTIEAEDPMGKGVWGVLSPPGGTFFRGGYGCVIPSASASQNKKAAAARACFALTPDGSKAVIALGQFSAYQNAYNADILGKTDPYFESRLMQTFFNWFSVAQQKQHKLEYSPYYDVVGKSAMKEAYNMMTSNLSAQQTLAAIRQDLQDSFGSSMSIQ